MLIERLERRQLFDAGLGASFAGGAPEVIRPEGVQHAAIRIVDSGTAATGVVDVTLFASSQPGLAPNAVALTRTTQQVRLGRRLGATIQLRFSAPQDLPDGLYYLVASVELTSPGRSNLSTVVVAHHTSAFHSPFVDLVGQVTDQPGGPIFVSAGQPGVATATIAVLNAGNVPARGPLTITIYASPTPTLGTAAVPIGRVLAGKARIPSVGVNFFTVQLRVPAGMAPGSYFLLAQVNSSGGIVESNTANDLVEAPAPLVLTDTPPVFPPRHHHHHHFQGDQSGFFADGGFGFIGFDGAFLDSADPFSASASDMTDSGGMTDMGGPTTDPSGSGGDPSGGTGGDMGGGSGDMGGGGGDTGGGSGDMGGGGGDTGGGGGDGGGDGGDSGF